MIEPLTRLLKPLDDSPQGHQYLIETLNYYLRACKFGKPYDFEKAKVIIESILSENTSSEIMSIMDHVEAKGRQEGYQSGANQRNHEIAAGMLIKGYPVTDIVELTGLSPEEVQKLKAETEH